MNKIILLILSLVICNCATVSAKTPANFKVAFIGDQGLNSSSRSVLNLIKSEKSEIVIHQGDFDYLDNPKAWEKQINNILGENFPYVASAGNHDVKKWFGTGGYRDLLQKRAARTPDLKCTGDHGVNGTCVYKGLFIVTSGVGSLGKKTFEYLDGVLKQSGDFVWKVCSWHKQMRAYQLGDKGNSVPWKYYKACREAGAIIAQGHEHSYSRTYTMSNFEKFTIADKSKVLKVGGGKSFTFTNGLGGASLRRQHLCKNTGDCPWWASIYTYDQGAKPGALFCTLNVDGKMDQANCYFKNINGKIIDEFEILNTNEERIITRLDDKVPDMVWFPTEISKSQDVWATDTDRHICL